MASTPCYTRASSGLSSIPFFPNAKAHPPISFLPFPHTCKPKFDFNPIGLKPSRLEISQRRRRSSEHLLRFPIISCLVEGNSGACSEPGGPSSSSDSPKDAAIDIKIPRRSLLVRFTCNGCGERSQKLVNRLAYERGTVFVQCSGCFQHHKLVDNLGLVVEYNFRQETDVDPNAN